MSTPSYQIARLAAPKDTEKKDTLDISPTLVVGIGGTGMEVLLRLRRRLVEAYGALENFPIVDSVYIDTAVAVPVSETGLDREKDLLMSKIKFDDNEWVPAGVNTADYVENIHSWDNIRRWLPLSGELHELGELSDGAGQIRPASRLAFFHNFSRIQNALESAKSRVADPAHAEKMKSLKITINTNKFFVYLVCSVAGGTGSGMLLDTAYLIRKVFKSKDMNLIGFIVLPGIFGEDKTLANGYAALKELNHYKFRNRFDVEWILGEREEPFAPPPFDYIYLVDSENESGAEVQKTDTLYRMVADNIFQDFSHSTFAGHKRAVKINLVQYLNRIYTHFHRDLQGRDVMQEAFPCRYSAFGIAAISIPADRIINSCASKLAADIISFWLSETDSTGVEKVTRELMNNILPSMQFLEGEYRQPDTGQVVGRNDILDKLCTGIEADISQWATDLQKNLLEGAAEASGTTWHDFLQERIRNQESLFTGLDEEDEKKWGEYRTTLKSRMEKVNRDFEAALDKEVTQLVSNKHLGPGFALAALRRMKEIFISNSFRYQPQFNELARVTYPAIEEDELRKLNDALNEIDEVGSWNRFTPRGMLRKTNLEIILKERLIPSVKAYFWTRYKKRAAAVASSICEQAMLAIGSEADDSDPENPIPATGQIAKIRGLITELEKMKKSFNGLYQFFKIKIKSDLVESLYEEEHIDRMYYPYVVGRDKASANSFIGNHAYEVIGKLGGDRIQDIIDLIRREGPQKVQDAIMGYTRELCKPIKTDTKNEFHVLNLLYKQGDVRDTLRTLYRFCRPWVSGNKKSIPGWTMSKDQRKFYVGIDHNHDRFSDFKRDLIDVVPAVDGLQPDFRDSADRSSIQLYTELAGYYAAWPASIGKLKEKYRQIRKAGQDLHNDKNQYAFRDLFPLSDTERASLKEAHKALLLGTIMDIVRVEERELSPYKTEDTYVFDKRIAINIKQPKYLGIEQAAVDELFNDVNPRTDRQEILEQAEERYAWLKERGRLAELYVLLEYYYSHVYKVEEVELEAGKKMLQSVMENDIVLEYLNKKIQSDISPEQQASFTQRVEELKGKHGSFTVRVGHGGKLALDFKKLEERPADRPAESGLASESAKSGTCSTPGCGQVMQPNWQICPSCGQPASSFEVTCPSPGCDQLIQANWKLCPACGVDLQILRVGSQTAGS